tara:strand:+ start:161 stop:580 length:420 start_codon:yes stop_codon:yes gene_type:complete
MENKYIELFERIAKENKVNFEYSFKSNVGRYLINEQKILTSKPINAERLQVGLHEIGHKLFINIKPSYLQEYLCEIFSFEIMRNHNIPIKKKIKTRSKKYIAIKTQMAINRGLMKIDNKVKNYIKKDYPKTAERIKGYI